MCEFLANLPLSRAEIVARLRGALGADHELENWPVETVVQLVAGKYGCAEWTSRR